jgi:hypothetical protein
MLGAVQSELTALHAQLTSVIGTDSVASAHDVYRDLAALEEEFECLDFDCRHGWLSVTTEPLELQGIYLGPFEVRLELSRIPNAERPPYRIIAKDPHPAESRDNVTHPHVMDEILCEGDGRQAIRQALAQGRLLDFFMLVAGVLRNYNPESPFVELALWYGQTCSDCGAVICDDESYVCERCGECVCEGCEVACCGCDVSCCSGCISACAACDENYCRRCLRPCSQCGANVCAGCLHDNERCPDCHEEEQSNANDDRAPAPSGAAIQPDGLGQAPVPA